MLTDTDDPLVKDPIYFQATTRLRQMLGRGEFVPGARFLTERQIAQRFQISRATANKALSSLVSEGALAFKKGVGTFVAAPRIAPLDYDLRALVSFTRKAADAGKTPSTTVLALEKSPAPPGIAARLGVSDTTPVWSIVRLRRADDTPVILERRHLRADLCPNLTEVDLAGSLYAHLTETLGLSIGGADETIRAVNVTVGDAALLEIPNNAAALLVVATAHLTDNTPLWHETTLYRGDSYVFRHHLGPISGANPPAFGALSSLSKTSETRSAP